jgi:hypothetical protein
MTMFDLAAVMVAMFGLILAGALVGGVAGFLLGFTCLYLVGETGHESGHLDDPPEDEYGADTEDIPQQAHDLALLSGNDGDGPGLYGGGRHRLREIDEPEWPTIATG